MQRIYLAGTEIGDHAQCYSLCWMFPPNIAEGDSWVFRIEKVSLQTQLDIRWYWV